MRIKCFGIARDIVGSSYLELKDEAVTDVRGLRSTLENRFPAFAQLKSYMIAVNEVYATDGDSLVGNEEIAIIPPVSGG